MRRSPFLDGVRVLLFVAGLLTIGAAVNRILVERSAPAPLQPAPEPPADPGKLTAEQRQSLLRSLQDQLEAAKAAQGRDLAFRARQKSANLMMTGASLSLAVLSLLFGILTRRRAGVG